MGRLYSIVGKLKRMLGRRRKQFIDHDAVNKILRTANVHEQLKTRSLDITVVFTNLNDFVTIFAELGDEKAVSLLNEYYGVMTPIVRRNSGYLCTFQFDRLFFFFGAIFAASNENHAAMAIQTVLEMQTAL